jgi:hypothetical protein
LTFSLDFETITLIYIIKMIILQPQQVFKGGNEFPCSPAMFMGFKAPALELDIIRQLFYRARQLGCPENRGGFYGKYAENSFDLNFKVLFHAGGGSKGQTKRRQNQW